MRAALPEEQRSGMSASNVSIGAIDAGSSGASRRRLQQGTNVQFSTSLSGDAAGSDVTDNVADAVESSASSGSLAT